MDTINNELKIIPEFREELFDKLYTFFKRYFNESGSIYFSSTPYQNRVYDKIYTENQDMVLFWKTNMLYYVKTDMLFENLMVETSGLKFLIDTEDIEHKKSNEKRNLVFKFDKINPVKNEIILKVSYSVRNTKTKMPELIKELTKELGKGVISEEILNSVFRTFRKQSEVDYFINKNAKEFLKEQFDLWIYQYMFKDITEFSSNRIKQLQVIKSISYKIIDFIAQFEDELVKIWRKPKFILNSNYVISYDKLADNKELIGKILMHGGITSQIEEWKELSLVEKDFSTENINDIKNFHLPFDTKYFKTLESEIISKFENLDDQIDGWMINSENFQALNTIKNKYKGQVKCIYIDPPFNLNSTDRFLYRTNYKDANWATLLENRLELAKELLHEDGLIFVRCDYHGSHIVKMILEKIFGNMKSEIIIERSRNEAGSPNKLETVNEWLYMFGKSEAPIQKVKTERSIANIKWTSFLMAGDRKPPQRTFLGKTLYPPKGQHFSLIQEKVDRLLTDHFLRLKCKDCGTYYFKADSTEELNVKMKTKKIDLSFTILKQKRIL
ncbi:DNA methyltransferase (plasmid) [Mammaliicoccus sciuri]|nr:DNA methyltransferase [Mammaliicoccus sciuri]